MEDGLLRVESRGRPDGCIEELRLSYPELVVFDAIGMYFGGLHIAGLEPVGFRGGGDPRRSGADGVYSP